MNKPDSSDEDNKIEKWLRDQTVVWSTPIPGHCLEGQGFEEGSLEEKYFAPLIQELSEPPRFPYFFKAKELEDVSEFDVIKNIRQGFADLLSEDNIPENYNRLVKLEDDMEARVEDLAARIDEAYGAQDPKTGEPSNTPEQARLLLSELDQQTSSDAPVYLDEVYEDIETEEREWVVTRDVGAITWGEAQINDKFSDLSEVQERPCMKVEEIGFDCDFDYLPADVPLNKLADLVRTYAESLEEDAVDLRKTYGLLCHRLQSLQSVLRDFALYGQVKELTEEDFSRREAAQEYGSQGGRKQVLDVEKLEIALRDVLKTYEHCWHDPEARYEGVFREKTARTILRDYKNDFINPDTNKTFNLNYIQSKVSDILDVMSQEEKNRLRKSATE